MLFKYVYVFLKLWLILELINWFAYLFIYIKIISPKFMKYKEVDTIKIIERVDKLSKEEIEYVIGGCIIYDKINHNNMDISKLNIRNLSKIEIINLIGFSLFGLEIPDIYSSKKLQIILKLISKIEHKLDYKFELSCKDRYLYRTWGSNFINFSFRPLILQLPIKIIVFSIHILFTVFLGFKWEQHNTIGFLSKKTDPNKKNLVFIHGFGLGYIPYFQTLIELDKRYNIIIMVLPNISSYNYYNDLNYAYFPPLAQLSDTFYNFLKYKNINQTILLSHSFGTYIAQILRKDCRSTVFQKIIMIDPIIFWIGCFKMSLYIENPFIKKYPITSYLFDNIINFMIFQCLYLDLIFGFMMLMN